VKRVSNRSLLSDSGLLTRSPSLLVEFATVGKTKEGKIYHHLWNADEINALLKEHGLAKVDDEPEAGDIK
jgi:20S proteasome subunit alpha 3